MAPNQFDRMQALIGYISGLTWAVEACLETLAEIHGDDARRKIEAMRDELIHKFKSSEVPAAQDLDHVKIVRPAVEAIETVFDGFLRTLDDARE